MKTNLGKGRIIKKIFCAILLIMILLNSYIAPITIFAEECKELVQANTQETVQASESAEKVEEPQKEESNNSTEMEVLVEENVKMPLLLSSIEPEKSKDVEIKTKNDEYEINVFETQFVAGAEADENSNLVWKPTDSAEGHQFSFRVNYALSGLKELPEGAIQITVPKSILRNRAGNLDDYYVMSLPTTEEYDGTTEFAYTEVEDYIVVYNPDKVEAGINGYFEIGYATNSQTFEYKDYDKTKTDTIPNGGTASDPFYAIINVKAGEDILKNKSDDKKVFIDTTAKIQSTQKRYPTIYRQWNSSWMENAPENSDKYYYLVWEIQSFVQEDPTQYYNFTLNDVIQDLTNGTDGKDYEIIGYKLSGERYYSDKNTQAELTRDGYRYDYVLTRHKIDTYQGIAYSLKNTITAIVDPIDQIDIDTTATSSNTFNWDPGFTPPTGHFNLFKYGNNTWYDKFSYYWDYANYDLDKLQGKEVEELKGFKYYTETIGYAYPWTLKDGGSLEIPADYGVNSVTYETWDDSLYLENDTTSMNTNDYYLEYLTYTVTNSDAEYDDFENKFKTISAKYEENETIKFYGKFNGEADWIEVGTYNLSTKQITSNETYVKSITTNKIEFKEGVNCTGWKFKTTNKHYYTHIEVTPYFAIRNSDYVLEKIKNKDSVKLQNNVSTIIKDYKENIIFEKETSGIDYARVTYWDSEITKKVSAVSNNVLDKTNTITWKVNAWETATSGSGKAEYVKQNSGIFYDLTPAGGEIDLTSVQVQTESGYLEENEYTSEIISNYKNSGRTMLVVKINEQAEYYTVYYNTVHSWESIKDYGRNVLNPVAYETGNEKIANGYEDNGGNLSKENKNLFTNLDDKTDAKKFIYTEKTYDINAVTAAISGLYKKVKNSEETKYSYETEVEPNGVYSYSLRYQNTYINKAKNLVFFDSLENFAVKDSETGKTTTSGWKGKLKSVDLSQLTKKGIDAKLYVSTVNNLNLEQNNNISDTKIWQQATKDTDLSKVTAIAIDMTKGIDGNDFELAAGDSISAIVYLEAPDKVTAEIENNPYAYNNIYMKNTLIDLLGGTQDYFIHQDYTKVKYHVIADVNFFKVNADNQEETIKGIVFRLYGKSNYGTEIDKYVASDKNGKVSFKDIEAGEYILQEYEGNPDWLEDHTEHRVKITNTREVYIDEKLVTEENSFKITNKPRIHTDVEFTKRNLVTNGVVEGVKFKLYGISKYGNEILMYAKSEADGSIVFENLEYGTYEMKEVEVPDGYILGNDEYRVVVDENGNSDILLKKTNTETRYAHSDNFADDGSKIGGEFGPDEIKTITIDGAKKLHVELKYGVHTGWVSVYDGTITPTIDNFDKSISGKLEGYSNTASCYYKKIYDIDGNTVQFYFNMNNSQYGPYGYYAVVTAEFDEYTSIYNKGKYNIYNEPLHSFRVIKRDDYSHDPIQGAKFKLMGVSDYGNGYNREIESTVAGFVDFTGIEAGTYVLQETYVPEVTDDQGNTINYILDETKYVVEIEKNGTVTIDGIEKNENGNFVIYNKRNKGQIVITKKWVDDSNNDERKEPTIYISTEKPVEARFQYFRNNYSLYDGPLYYIDSSYKRKITGSFERNTSFNEEEVISLGAKRIDREYNNPDAEYKIYGWIDSEGNCWWWSNAEIALMSNNSNKIFYGMNNVKSIDTTDINTSEVTDMRLMFYGCSNLTELDVSKFDTSNVTDMSHMFAACGKLIQLELSNFDTSEVIDMSSMFSSCRELTQLELSKFDTSKVTDMSYMFSFCTNLSELDVSKFDTSEVTDMSFMFSNCKNLTQIDVSNFDTSNVTNLELMFMDCAKLTELDLSEFDTNNVTNMDGIFLRCNNLMELDVNNFDTSNVITMRYVFGNCRKLTKLDISNFDTSKVTNMYSLFENCQNLTELDISKFNTSKVTNMSSMFNNCQNLTELDVSKFDTSKVTNMSSLFNNCQKLTELDVSKFDTSKVTNMSSMFNYCKNLTELDVSKFDTSKVTNISSLFNNCQKLTELDVSKFNTSKVTDMSYMFNYCQNLTELDVSKFDTSNVINMSSLFNNCQNLTELDVSKFDTSNVTNMSSLFNNCQNLTELDASNFDTRTVIDMSVMFSNCSKLKTIYTSEKFVTIIVTSSHSMFLKCYALVGGNGTAYNSSYTDRTYACIDKEEQKGYFTYKFNVSTEETEKTRFQYIRNNYNSSYGPLYYIDSDYKNKITGSFARNTNLTEAEVVNLGAKRLDREYNNPDAEYKIYSWIDESGNCWWWSNVEVVLMTNDSDRMFYAMNNVIFIDTTDIDTRKVTNMTYMFSSCEKLTKLDINKFDTSNVTDMGSMFNMCSSLTELDLSKFDTSNVTNMSSMFYRCKKLKELDVSNFDTSNVTGMHLMFYGCSNLTELDVSKFDTSSVTDMSSMFFSCYNLTELDVSKFDTSNVTNMGGMFYSCYNLTELDVSKFDTSNVIDMGSMFVNCYNLTELDVSNFDTSNVIDMEVMFSGCSKLKIIYASEKFMTVMVIRSNNMFANCYALVGGNGTTYNSSYTDKTYACIDKEGHKGYFAYKENSEMFINNEDTVTSFVLKGVKTKLEPITIREVSKLKTKNFASSVLVSLDNSKNETNEESAIIKYSTANKNYDNQGNEIKWVKNGDTWLYTFYVDDPNATWYIWEENMEGYGSNYTVYYPGIVEKQQSIITNIKTEVDTSVKYQEPLIGYGNLKIIKSLIGLYDNGSNKTLTKEDDNTEFTFTVTLTAKEGQESLISGIQVFGDYVFKDGIGKIKLHAGEEAIIPNLPAGTTYKVMEDEIGDYILFSGSTGTITKDQTITINANNFKDERNTNTKTTNFTVTKKVTGNYEKEEIFNFELLLNNLKPDTKYTLSNGMNFVSDSEGNADVSISLKNGESVTVQNISVGSKYKVYEYAGEYISSYVITDSNNLGLINNSSNRNTKENVALATAIETADEGEDVVIEFTNNKNVEQNLKLVKEVTDENDKNNYLFTVEFGNMKANSSFNSTVGKVIADSTGKALLEIYLAGGEEAEFYNIPIGTTYKITEQASGAIASYVITDLNGENKIANSTKANTANKTALSTEEEVVNEDEEAVVTFINDIVNQEPDSVEVGLGVTKNVLDINGKVLENCEETFTFEIVPENEQNPMPANKAVQIKGNGTESFGTIVFTKPGTYTYKVTEKAGELDYYTYDDTEYEIVYEVTNPEGLLEVTKTIKKDGFITNTIVFTNKISKVDIGFLKINEEGSLLEGSKLQILDELGNVVKEWIVGKDEYSIKLPPGKYTLHEVEALEGYEVAEDIIFVIAEDGEIIVNDDVVETVIMKNKKVKEESSDSDKENINKPEDSQQNDNIQNKENQESNKVIEQVKTGDTIIYFPGLLIASAVMLIILNKKKK